MGGFGSGRYQRRGSRSQYLVADQEVPRLDIRELYKDGFLDACARGTISWFRHGHPAGSIGIYSDPCDFALLLDYETGHPPRAIRERVPLTYTVCHFGGDRPWFRCPACGQRCAVLWGRVRFLCRLCQGVAYASQNESASDRAIRRVHEIRAKLKVDGAIPIWLIRRPRYMRHDRYRALIFELIQHEGVCTRFVVDLAGSMGLLDPETGPAGRAP